jgi:hypothetical protein
MVTPERTKRTMEEGEGRLKKTPITHPKKQSVVSTLQH